MVVASLALAFAGLATFTLLFSRAVEARYPVVGALVDVGPGALHVVETAPRGPERGAVLLTHGASGNFADLHVALAESLATLGFRVFAIDRPGHGWSDRLGPRREAASPRVQAQWLRLALQKRGVESAIVVSHSLSGVLGLAMALDAPAFTRGLVLLAPVAYPWQGGVSWYYGIAASPLMGGAFRWLLAPLLGLATLNKALVATFAPNAVPRDYAERTRVSLVLRPWQFLANAEDFVDLCNHAATLSPRYGEIARPTAIIMGEFDTLVSRSMHAERCAHEIAGATLCIMKGIGHSPHFADPGAVVAEIVEVDRRAGISSPVEREGEPFKAAKDASL